MTALTQLAELPKLLNQGEPRGIISVCSAHPNVIVAALEEAAETGQCICIEATCNQVNQEGGYTEMQPADFRDMIFRIVQIVNFDTNRIILGGDHLGPNPWRNENAAKAMEKAIAMTAAYAAAGFGKIHVDASMSCADDPVPLPKATIAKRAASLVAAAEEAARLAGHPAPLYTIGTEVPVPGGAAEELETLTPTTPADADETLKIHMDVFKEQGLTDVFERVIAMVVQPGVEFGHSDVIAYDPRGAEPLVKWRNGQNIVFEAHSTDYQSTESLQQLVKDGFSILKVGPGLSFAFREALYALDLIAAQISDDYPAMALPKAIEDAMVAAPEHWEAYYKGNPVKRRFLRHFSYSDRVRYYWTHPPVQEAVKRLIQHLGNMPIPLVLISQYMPHLYEPVRNGQLKPEVSILLTAAIRHALRPYSLACTD